MAQIKFRPQLTNFSISSSQGSEGQIPISYLPPVMSKQLKLRLAKPRSSTQAHPQRIDYISANRSYAIAIKEIAAYAHFHWAIALFHAEPAKKQPEHARQAPRRDSI